MAPVESILLVEDNGDDELLMRRALQKHAIVNVIEVARDGEEALARLSEGPSKAGVSFDDLPRLVLLDINLPKLGGLDVLRRLRRDAWTRNLPVVLLTSVVDEHEALRSSLIGPTSWMRKPFDLGQFHRAVVQTGLRWFIAASQQIPAVCFCATGAL